MQQLRACPTCRYFTRMHALIVAWDWRQCMCMPRHAHDGYWIRDWECCIICSQPGQDLFLHHLLAQARKRPEAPSGHCLSEVPLARPPKLTSAGSGAATPGAMVKPRKMSRRSRTSRCNAQLLHRSPLSVLSVRGNTCLTLWYLSSWHRLHQSGRATALRAAFVGTSTEGGLGGPSTCVSELAKAQQ